MTKGQQVGPMQRRPRKPQPRQPRKLSAHRAFAPMLGIWGAALGGLCVLVLPAQLITQLGNGTGVMLLGPQAQVVLAGGAAVLLGGALFGIANTIFRKGRLHADAPLLVSLASRHVRAIDPKRELGSASLDEPLVAMPFAAAAVEPAQSAEPVRAAPKPVDPIADMPPPLALDLAQFAELPGRNAVWVEDIPNAAPVGAPLPNSAPVAQPVAQPVALAAVPETPPAPPAAAEPSAAALALLRAQPPENLSIVQMVERFAGALHERRAGASGKALTGRDLAAREAALAEALKALAALSGFDAAPVQDEPLRDALSRLQGLRGAA